MMSRISKIQNHLQNTQTYINIYLLSPLSGLLKSAAYFSQISISIFPWWGLVSRRLGYFLCRAHQGWKIYDTKRGQINFALLCKMEFSGFFTILQIALYFSCDQHKGQQIYEIELGCWIFKTILKECKISKVALYFSAQRPANI